MIRSRGVTVLLSELDFGVTMNYRAANPCVRVIRCDFDYKLMNMNT